MPYRIIKETGMFGIPIYVPQKFDVENDRWSDLEWGYDEHYREWAFTIKSAKCKIEKWKHNGETPEVVWKE